MEPRKKIASRSREWNIILMSPGMLRYPFPRISLSSLSLPSPLPSPESSSKPRLMPPTFNPVFVSLRFRVFLYVSLVLFLSPSFAYSFSFLTIHSVTHSDDNIQFTSRLVIRTRHFTLSPISEASKEFLRPLLINNFPRADLGSVRDYTEHDFISFV